MLCWTFLMSFNTLNTDTTWSDHCGVSSELTYRFRLRPTHLEWMVSLWWGEQWPTDSDWDLHIQTETYRFRLRPTYPDWDLQSQTETYRFRPNGQSIVEWAVTYRFRLRPTHSDWMVGLLWSEQWPDLQIQTETYTFRLNGQFIVEWAVTWSTDSDWDLHIQTKTYRSILRPKN